MSHRCEQMSTNTATESQMLELKPQDCPSNQENKTEERLIDS